MLMTMEPEIQRNLKTLHAHEMLLELKTLFAQQAEQELLQTTRVFHPCKQEERQSVSSYVLEMKGYIDNLERLGHPVTLGLGVSLILIGLRKEFDGFVQNYNMHSLGKTINELHAMLKLHEQTLPKTNAPTLHADRAGVWLDRTLKEELSSVLGRVAEEEKERSFGSWWFRKLKPEALSLYVGSGQREAVKAIGVFYLCLPSGLEIVLNNCHYAPSITRGVISVSRLYEDGFINHFVNNTIQVSRNNMVYFSAIPRDSIFVIDLSNSYTNKSSIYAVRIKRAKLDLDSALLWHCRLGHISKKRIEKLQHDGLLNSTDLRAFEKCVSCMFRKMARKPYTHQVERAKDLLGLIHTDIEKTPYEVWHGQAPNLSYFKVSGCKALVKRDTPTKPDKLEPISIKCIFIGYPKETMGYSFYYPPENKVLVARNAELLENNTSLNHKEGDLEIDEHQRDIFHIRRSTGTRYDPDRMCLYIDAEEHELGDLDNEVWILVELPPNGKTVGSKWLFKKKTDMDGFVHSYKARLVAKGYTQTLGIDYEVTFSLVADIRAIRILIAIDAYYDYEIWQMNVKTAFLNGYLNEEVKLQIFLESRSAEIDHGEKLKLSKSQGASTPADMKRMQNVPYVSAVGSIMYDVRCTSPCVRSECNKPISTEFRGDLKRELRVSCYTDAGYLTDADDLKSQTGYVFVLNGGVVD
nr:retrotransposon protein, putative, Ty1-copia subclass [Tanacetum cinerariifolium]